MRWLISELESETPGWRFTALLALGLTTIQTLILFGLLAETVSDARTPSGFAILGAFIVTNYLSTFIAVVVILPGRLLHHPRWSMVVHGGWAGGVNGAAFLLLVIFGAVIWDGGDQIQVSEVPALLGYSLFLAKIAFAVGVIPGLIAAFVDILLLKLANRGCRCRERTVVGAALALK